MLRGTKTTADAGSRSVNGGGPPLRLSSRTWASVLQTRLWTGSTSTAITPLKTVAGLPALNRRRTSGRGRSSRAAGARAIEGPQTVVGGSPGDTRTHFEELGSGALDRPPDGTSGFLTSAALRQRTSGHDGHPLSVPAPRFDLNVVLYRAPTETGAFLA